eukprot:gnl/TRDRNA2_/TRDRNA2_54717_c0_seq1.p1 gnl/TRDRNA2_/TRDRNA2_54717_c0~~gnl/TRDRNA2_/TRDRNA2_54717_c0_seq1.p1  ORF type:complete len:131 (+),score=8.38 gnl/TRDRNA2_/TRDRNA2_54717_c0_seq1:125-517(+)
MRTQTQQVRMMLAKMAAKMRPMARICTHGVSGQDPSPQRALITALSPATPAPHLASQPRKHSRITSDVRYVCDDAINEREKSEPTAGVPRALGQNSFCRFCVWNRENHQSCPGIVQASEGSTPFYFHQGG